VRIGDRVWAFSAAESGSALLVPGLVDVIQTGPDGTPHEFRIRMEVRGSGSGGPLFNDLGEIIGILTIADEETRTLSGSVIALTSDSLRRMLNAAR
jgi:molecular chaperone DnaK